MAVRDTFCMCICSYCSLWRIPARLGNTTATIKSCLRFVSFVCCGRVCFPCTPIRSAGQTLDGCRAVLNPDNRFQINNIKEELQRVARRRDENVTVISDTSGQCSLVFLSRFSTKLIIYANVLCWIWSIVSSCPLDVRTRLYIWFWPSSLYTSYLNMWILIAGKYLICALLLYLTFFFCRVWFLYHNSNCCCWAYRLRIHQVEGKLSFF